VTANVDALVRLAQGQFSDRQFERAETTLSGVLMMDPRHAGAHLLQAAIDLRADRYRSAHAHVLAVAAQPPGDAGTEYDLFQRLRSFNEHALMIDSAQRLLALKPLEIGHQMQVASSLSGIGAPELAVRVWERMQSRDPRHIATLLTEGYLATNQGEFDRAERALEAGIARESRLAMAHWLLARLRTQTAASNHVERLRRVLADRSLTPPDRMQIGFALHKELHDLGEFAAAWDALSAACALKRQVTPYDEPAMMALFDALEAAPSAPSSNMGRHADATPIFIVGMHRSGTTLLERMLGRHPQVVDCGETYRFTAQLREAADHHCKGVVDARIVQVASRFAFDAIARGYLESCRWRLRDGATHYTEKLPSNFLIIGLIKHALPEARILHMRRDAMDTGLSNLRELFSDACAYSYDQGELGRYYRRYERLMAHWHRCFPGEILDVRYEDLVANTEVEARRVLDYCGLPWRDDVIDVTGHSGAVTTASAVQVRSPIHRRSVGAWRAYEAQLAPLREILEA
jgi:tetratricopeptide (TPR) repeat protein